MENDSDDFVPDPPKVSRLTRKKKKKDPKSKMKTSSQVPSSEVAVSSAVEDGRPPRKSAEERRFEREARVKKPVPLAGAAVGPRPVRSMSPMSVSSSTSEQSVTDSQAPIFDKHIEVVKREVEEVKKEMEGAKKEMEGVKKEMEGAKKEMEGAKKEMGRAMKQVESLKTFISTEMKEIKTMLSNQAQATLKDQPKLECPVCFETIKPPMRLKQCEKGHIICDNCVKSRQRHAGIVNVDIACFVCKFPVRSRPTALEQFLGLL